jgi:MFS superfamily sulfate permease-like transporter
LNGVVSIGVGYLFFKLFMYIPSIVMEAIVFTLNLRTTRFEEVAYTVRHDGKLIATDGVVFCLMMFQRPSNSILIGIYFYLAVLANELMAPQNEVTFTGAISQQPKLAIKEGEENL